MKGFTFRGIYYKHMYAKGKRIKKNQSHQIISFAEDDAIISEGIVSDFDMPCTMTIDNQYTIFAMNHKGNIALYKRVWKPEDENR